MDTPQNHKEFQIQQAIIFRSKLDHSHLSPSPIGKFLSNYLIEIMKTSSDDCLAIAQSIAAIKELEISENQVDIIFLQVLDYLYKQMKNPILTCINSMVIQMGNNQNFKAYPYPIKLIQILDDLDSKRNYEFANQIIHFFILNAICTKEMSREGKEIIINLMSIYGHKPNPQIFMILCEHSRRLINQSYPAIVKAIEKVPLSTRCDYALWSNRIPQTREKLIATERLYYSRLQNKFFEEKEISTLLNCYHDYIAFLTDIHADEISYKNLEEHGFNFTNLQSSNALNPGFAQPDLDILCFAHPPIARLLNLTRFAHEMNTFFQKTYNFIKDTNETDWKTQSWFGGSFTPDKSKSVRKIEDALKPYEATKPPLSLFQLFEIYEQLNKTVNDLKPYPLEPLEGSVVRDERLKNITDLHKLVEIDNPEQQRIRDNELKGLLQRKPNLRDGRHEFTRNFLIEVINGLQHLEGIFPEKIHTSSSKLADDDFCIIEHPDEEQLYNKFIGTFAPGTKFTDEEFKELMQFYSELLQGIINDPSRHPQNLPEELKPEEFQKWLNGCFNFHFPHLSCVMFNMTSMQQPFDIIRESNPFIQRLFNICAIISHINQFISNVQADIKTAETKTKGNADSGLYVKMMGDSFAEGTPETVDALIKIINRYLEDRESTEFSKTIKAYIEMKNILTPLLSTIHLPDPNRHRNTRKLYYDVLSKWIELFNMIAGLNNNITTNQKCRKYPLLPPFQEEVKKSGPNINTVTIPEIEGELEETDSSEEPEQEGDIRLQTIGKYS